MYISHAGWIGKYLRKNALVVLAVLLASSALHAQSREAASGGGQSLWVGGEFSNMQVGFPYGSNWRMSGIGAFALFNWNHSIGVQAETNFLRFNSFYGESQTSFLVGPRYTFLHSSKWRPYAQFSIGDVRTKYPFDIGSGNSFALAPAGGLDYHLKRRWAVQAQYEYQFLTNSPNFTDEPHFGMRPNGIQIGVSYRLHRAAQ